jgi:hypothetical protein
MPHEPTPIQKTAARWGLVSLLVFIIGLLGLHSLYASQKQKIVNFYLGSQKDLAWTAASECLEYLSGIEQAMKSLAQPVFQSDTWKNESKSELKKFMRIYGGTGIESVALYDKNGLEASAGPYFSAAGGPIPKHIEFIHSLMAADKIETTMSDVTPMKGPARQLDAAALLAAASDTTPLSSCGRDSQAPASCPGIAIAMLNTRTLSYSLQRLSRGENKPILFVIDSKGIIVSHPLAEFIGADSVQALDLEHNPELEQVIAKMRKGDSGDGEYDAPSRVTGKGSERWQAAYVPVSFGGNNWSVAVTFQERDVLFLGTLFRRYLAAALLWLGVIAGVNIIYLRSKSHAFGLERRVRQLADSAAVNDILRNVNSEINDAKRKLEVKTKEFEAIHHEREAMLERLEELQKHLFASISRPTRESREAMREMRKIVRVLRRPPEGRFWKHVDEE